jgi:Na+-translocating ferredoxin:NAD+ oxidoreductase RnfA subunit
MRSRLREGLAGFDRLKDDSRRADSPHGSSHAVLRAGEPKIEKEVAAVAENAGPNPATKQRPPGWEPDYINPSLQRYWDGSQVTAKRRWVSGQWVSEPTPVPDPSTAPPSTAPAGANPSLQYARQFGQQPPPGTATNQRAASTLTAAMAGLFICGVLLIVGSATAWITLSFGLGSVSASGTSISLSHSFVVNGWFTLTAGILLIVLAAMIFVSGDALYRSLGVLVSLVAAGCAIYALVRILQLTSQIHAPTFDNNAINAINQNAGVGWGLIVVLIGAIGAVVCAWSESRAPRSR